MKESTLKKIKKAVGAAVKAGGPLKKNTVVQLSVVLDLNMDKDFILNCPKEVLSFLRKENTHFSDLRINLVRWKNDESIEKLVSSYPEFALKQTLLGTALLPEETEDEVSEDEVSSDEVSSDEISEDEVSEDEQIIDRKFDYLLSQLYKNYGKSRFILVFTDESVYIDDSEKLKEIIESDFAPRIVFIHPGEKITYPLSKIIIDVLDLENSVLEDSEEVEESTEAEVIAEEE